MFRHEYVKKKNKRKEQTTVTNNPSKALKNVCVTNKKE